MSSTSKTVLSGIYTFTEARISTNSWEQSSLCLKPVAPFCAQVLVSQHGCDQSEPVLAGAGLGLGGCRPCFQSLDGGSGGGWLERGQGASQEEEFQLKPLRGLANPCQWSVSPDLNGGDGVNSNMVISKDAVRE